MSHQFEKYLKDHGINNIKCSPYSPQSNGVVERFHSTLNSRIRKSVEKKRNWVDVVPLILFFVKTTPHASTGFSPFLLKHGWEPVTPIQLLYKGWVQEELASLEIDQWVLENAEHIQTLRIAAGDKLSQNSSNRKERLDKGSKQREFAVGDLVLYKALGAETKLAPTWEGPYTIVKVLGPVTYGIDVGMKKFKTTHVKFLKEFVERNQVKRVTTVVHDSIDDTIDDHGFNRVEIG